MNEWIYYTSWTRWSILVSEMTCYVSSGMLNSTNSTPLVVIAKARAYTHLWQNSLGVFATHAVHNASLQNMKLKLDNTVKQNIRKLIDNPGTTSRINNPISF